MANGIFTKGTATLEKAVGKAMTSQNYDDLRAYEVTKEDSWLSLCCACFDWPVVLKGTWKDLERAKQYLEGHRRSATSEASDSSRAYLLGNSGDIYSSARKPNGHRARALATPDSAGPSTSEPYGPKASNRQPSSPNGVPVLTQPVSYADSPFPTPNADGAPQAGETPRHPYATRSRPSPAATVSTKVEINPAPYISASAPAGNTTALTETSPKKSPRSKYGFTAPVVTTDINTPSHGDRARHETLGGSGENGTYGSYPGRRPLGELHPTPSDRRPKTYKDSLVIGLYQWLWYKNKYNKHFMTTVGKKEFQIIEEPNDTSINVTIQATAKAPEAARIAIQTCKKEIGDTLDWINNKDEFVTERLSRLYTEKLASIECPPNTHICKDSDGKAVILAEHKRDIQAAKEKLRQGSGGSNGAAPLYSSGNDNKQTGGFLSPTAIVDISGQNGTYGAYGGSQPLRELSPVPTDGGGRKYEGGSPFSPSATENKEKSGFLSATAIIDKSHGDGNGTVMIPKPPTPNKKRKRRLAQPKDQADTSQPAVPMSAPAPTSLTGGSYRYIYGQQIHVFMGDLTRLMVGAVVNASNPQLMHGGGVAGAVKKAAGPGLQEECTNRVKKYGTIEMSNVYTSAAYNMPCQYIIHVAGPRWTDYTDKRQAETLLYQSFLNCLLEAERLHQPSVALPAVGSGIYGSPLPVVAQQMYKAVQNFLNNRHDNSHIQDIILVDISAAIVDLLIDIMAREAAAGTVTILAPNFQLFITEPNTSSAVAAGQSIGMAENIVLNAAAASFDPPLEAQTGIKDASARTEDLLAAHTTSGADVAEDDCCICMDKATDKVVLAKCRHVFCKECISTWFNDKPSCPTCGEIYGEMTGYMPEGTMTTFKTADTIPGYEDTPGAIMITYDFPGGTQQDCHPNPGYPYRGTTRTGVLPDNEEGNQVLGLLRRAFEAKLTFTIGRSTTTGREDQITWNDIHHKTSIKGGSQRFGYPDPTYLSRVKDELAAKGIK